MSSIGMSDMVRWSFQRKNWQLQQLISAMCSFWLIVLIISDAIVESVWILDHQTSALCKSAVAIPNNATIILLEKIVMIAQIVHYLLNTILSMISLGSNNHYGFSQGRWKLVSLDELKGT